MPAKETPVKKIVSDKENLLQAVTEQLQTALPVLKEQLGEKKFEKRIKKAAKLLIAGIKKAPAKKLTPVVKKIVPAKKKDAKVVKSVKVIAKN